MDVLIATVISVAKQPKEIWISEGGGHLKVFSNESNRQRLIDYFRDACQANPRQ